MIKRRLFVSVLHNSVGIQNTVKNNLRMLVKHPKTSILAPSGQLSCVPASEVRIVDCVHYILYNNAESTLKALFNAISQHAEFCVVPDDFKITESSSNKKTADTTKDKHFFQCMSAGSGGNPKRIRRSYASWLASISVNKTLFELNDTDSYALIGHLTHSLPLYAVIEAAQLGADIHCLSGSRPNTQWCAMHKLQTSILYATPTQLRLLCSANQNAVSKIESVRHVFSGGGKLDAKTRKLLSNCFPSATVHEFYGASETSFITMSDEHTPADSVGKAYPGVTIKIAGDENNDQKKPGEIWISSPYVFTGYAEGEQPGTIWNNDFVTVGEMGWMNNDGYLFIAGRKSRAINIADSLVYPEHLENLLCEHPVVKRCAVVSIENNKRGATLIAVVEHEQQHNTDLQQALLRKLRASVGTMAAPKKIVFVAQLPTLASGKPNLLEIQRAIDSLIVDSEQSSIKHQQ